MTFMDTSYPRPRYAPVRSDGLCRALHRLAIQGALTSYATPLAFAHAAPDSELLTVQECVLEAQVSVSLSLSLSA